MKKLLLITFLFLITPDAKADMDYVCEVNFFDNAYYTIFDNCERNNILFMRNIHQVALISVIAQYCRQDREINFIQQKANYDLSCVLYDKKPRESLETK